MKEIFRMGVIMNTKHLEYFIKTGKSNSINEAAASLYISQPSLWYALNSLEKELGIKLFKRSQKGVELTAKGEKVLEDSRKIIDIIESWNKLRDSQNDSTDYIEAVTISGIGVLSDTYVPQICSYINRQFPTIHTTFLETTFFSFYKDQLFSQYNNILMFDFVTREQLSQISPEMNALGWNCTPIAEGPIYLLVNSENPLAKKDALHINDLVKFNYLAVNEIIEAQCYPKIYSYFDEKQLIHASSREATFNLVSLSADTVTTAVFLSALECNYVSSGKLKAMPFSDYPTPAILTVFYPDSVQPLIHKILDYCLHLFPSEYLLK